jgi:hypothetical protein
MLVEAKKQDIEAGLGQCAAQMVVAHRFNQKKVVVQGPQVGGG